MSQVYPSSCFHLSRREFLKLTALGSLGLALGGGVFPTSALASGEVTPTSQRGLLDMAVGPAMLGPGSLIQSGFGSPGNLEALVLEGQRLVHFFYLSNDRELYWRRGPTLTDSATGPACLIESSFGKSSTRPGNFEAVVLEGSHLFHYFKDNGSIHNPWIRVPTPISTRATGPGCIIEGSFGKSSSRPGNFEVIVPEGNVLAHYFKDNNSIHNPWVRAGAVISTRATGPGCIIEGSFGKSTTRPGNFEVVVLEGSELIHYFKDNGSIHNPWIRVPTPISTRATGPACLIEGNFGKSSTRPGNFEVIVLEGHELVHYFKDNGSIHNPWRRGQTITTSALRPGTIIQSSLGVGTHKNFEVLVQECFGSAIHYTHPNQNVALPWLRQHIVTALGPWPIKLSRTQKVAQLTGEFDRQLGQPTINQTELLAGVRGTDLGSSFEHKGAVYFLFGDTWRTSHNPSSGPNDDLDAIASTADRTAYDGLRLTFNGEIVGRIGDRFQVNSLPPRVFDNGQPIRQAAFEVPLDGFSHHGRMYVFFSTDNQDIPIRHKPQASGTLNAAIMGRTLLAASTDTDHDGYTFEQIFELSREKFINVSVEKVADSRAIGLPGDGEGLLIWGCGRYRASDVYLAYLPLNRLHDRSTVLYFTGLDDHGSPRWSGWEGHAVPLFCAGCVGELSVRWNRFLRRWIMMYNGDPPRGILARLSPTPWGPWDDKRLVFDPGDGYGRFMHQPGRDTVNDRMFGADRSGEYGGEYGPYQITRYTTGWTGRYTKIYFTLSTWNPYQVMQMSAVIPMEGDTISPLSPFVDLTSPPVLKFALLATRLAELTHGRDIRWEVERQGSLDDPDHIEWASYETIDTIREELKLRYKTVLRRLEDQDAQADIYAEWVMTLIRLGGVLSEDVDDLDHHRAWARETLASGEIERLFEMMCARLDQPGLLAEGEPWDGSEKRKQ